MLYAQIGDAAIAAIIAVATVLGGGAGWLIKVLLDLRTQRRSENVKDEETAVTRLEKLLDRVDKERMELGDEVHKLENRAEKLVDQLHETRVQAIRANDWIRYLETTLDNAKVPYRKREEVVGRSEPDTPTENK